MPLLSTDPAHPSTPRIARLRQARRELRRGASAVLDATQDLAGRDYEVATRLIDSADLLLKRFMKLEGRAAV